MGIAEKELRNRALDADRLAGLIDGRERMVRANRYHGQCGEH
jgi:hypothetical protein